MPQNASKGLPHRVDFAYDDTADVWGMATISGLLSAYIVCIRLFTRTITINNSDMRLINMALLISLLYMTLCKLGARVTGYNNYCTINLEIFTVETYIFHCRTRLRKLTSQNIFNSE